jgi:hypothetical protein
MLLLYFNWLYYNIMQWPRHRYQHVFAEFKDIYRDDTVETYKEWLRVQGQLDDICNITTFAKI